MSYQHWFVTFNTRSSTDLYKYLNKYHFICLQEIDSKRVEKLVTKLNKSKNKRFYTAIEKNGLAVITCFHILNSQIGHLDVGYGSEEDVYIKVTIDLTEKDSGDKNNLLTIFCTHLDKNSEETRMGQIVMSENALQDADILMGCLNSLYFPDYNPTMMDTINEQRLARGQEVSDCRVMNYILEQNFEITKYINPTCTDGVRVDYILTKKDKNLFRNFDEICKLKNKVNPTSYHYMVSSLIFKGGRDFVL